MRNSKDACRSQPRTETVNLQVQSVGTQVALSCYAPGPSSLTSRLVSVSYDIVARNNFVRTVRIEGCAVVAIYEMHYV